MSVYKLLIELTGKDKGATRALKGVKQQVGGLESAAKGLQGGLLAAAGVAGIGFLAKQAVGAAFEIAELGARFEDVTRNLEAFSGGAYQASRFLDAVVDASGRTIDNMMASAAASRMLQMGLADTTDEMALYVEGAVRLGNQTQSSNQRVEEMIALLKNLNPLMYDNFGLSRQVINARRDELKATQGLSAEAATLQSIQEEIRRQLVVLGPLAESDAQKFDQMDVAVTNLKLAAGQLVDTPLAEFLEGVASGLNAVSEAITPDEFEELAKEIAGVRRELEWIEGSGWGWSEAAEEARFKALKLHTEFMDLASPIEQAGDAMEDTTYQVYGLEGAMQQTLTTGAAFEKMWFDIAAGTHEAGMAIDGVMRELGRVSPEEAISGFGGAAGQAQSRLMSLVGIVDKATLDRLYGDYTADLKQLYQNTTGLTDFELARRAQIIENRLEDEIDLYKDAVAKQADVLDDSASKLRSSIEAALGAGTQVTALDVEQTTMGTYADKWDEDARRWDAIASRGFAELEAHPDWAAALEIPPEILNSTEAVLKEWARQQSDNFRNLMLPMDKTEIARAMETVRDYIQQQAQREANIEAIAVAYTAQYGGTEEQARAALGDTGAMGGIAADEVMAGFTAALQVSTPAAQFARYFKTDLQAAEEALYSRGVETWQALEKGLLDEMSRGNYASAFAEILLPFVLQAWREKRQYTGGGTDE